MLVVVGIVINKYRQKKISPHVHTQGDITKKFF